MKSTKQVKFWCTSRQSTLLISTSSDHKSMPLHGSQKLTNLSRSFSCSRLRIALPRREAIWLRKPWDQASFYLIITAENRFRSKEIILKASQLWYKDIETQSLQSSSTATSAKTYSNLLQSWTKPSRTTSFPQQPINVFQVVSRFTRRIIIKRSNSSYSSNRCWETPTWGMIKMTRTTYSLLGSKKGFSRRSVEI